MLTPEKIRELWENYSPTKGIESFARSVESAALEATAKNAFEAMPHDIPQRMKDTICEETGWSGSMASRMYTELRKAFTGEPYKANEDLDAALLEVARLRKDAERYAWLRSEHERADPVCHLTWKLGGQRNGSEWVNTARLDSDIDAAIRALNTEGPDAAMAQKGGE